MAAGVTYEPLATTTLTATSTTITFSSISGSYTDLRLVFVGFWTGTGVMDTVNLRFNSDTGANYSYTTLSGNGSAAASNRNTDTNQIYLDAAFSLNGTIPALATIDIFGYAGSTYKSALGEWSNERNGITDRVARQVALWRSTSTITSISIFNANNNFGIGTTATLYGILKA